MKSGRFRIHMELLNVVFSRESSLTDSRIPILFRIHYKKWNNRRELQFVIDFEIVDGSKIRPTLLNFFEKNRDEYVLGHFMLLKAFELVSIN